MFFQFRSEGLVAAEELPKSNKRPDDVNAHLNGSSTVQDVGRLNGTVLGENERQVSATTATDDL
jgi:hypothetical protein